MKYHEVKELKKRMLLQKMQIHYQLAQERVNFGGGAMQRISFASFRICPSFINAA